MALNLLNLPPSELSIAHVPLSSSPSPYLNVDQAQSSPFTHTSILIDDDDTEVPVSPGLKTPETPLPPPFQKDGFVGCQQLWMSMCQSSLLALHYKLVTCGWRIFGVSSTADMYNGIQAYFSMKTPKKEKLNNNTMSCKLSSYLIEKNVSVRPAAPR